MLSLNLTPSADPADPTTEGDGNAPPPDTGADADAAALWHGFLDAQAPNQPRRAGTAPEETDDAATVPTASANSASNGGAGTGAGSPLISDAGAETINQLFGPAGSTNFNATRAQILAAVGASGLSYTGAGIMVGVISGSFGDLFQLAASQSNPNPASQNPALNEQAGTLAPSVDVVADGPLNAPAELLDDEGRAMLQVVHDIAPGASEAFYSSLANGGTPAGFAIGILELAAAGCKVICDDVSLTDEPWFQGGTTSPPLQLVNGQLVGAQAAVIDQAIATVTAEGVVYVSCASNDGAVAYENPSPWTSTTVEGLTLSDQIVAFSNTLNFGTAQSPTPFINLTLNQPLSIFGLALQWDQAWGNAASQLEIDIWVYNPGLGVEDLIAAFNQTANNGENSDGNPLDPVIVVPQSDLAGAQGASVGPGTVQISIRVLSGPDPTFIKLVTGSNGSFTGQAELTSYQTGANLDNTGTSTGHNDGLHVLTAGAVDTGNAPANNTSIGAPVSEPFSASAQNSYYLLGPNGNPIAPFALPGVAVSGVDDIATTVASSLSDFLGTSCATPTVAAVVALLMQADPHLNLTGMTYVLEKTATPTISVTGTSDPAVGGAGLINASAAIALALSVPPPSLAGAGTTVTYDVGGAAIAIGAGLTVSDPSALANDELASAAVSITAGFLGGDTLSASTAGTAITESYNGSIGVLSLSGTDTLADYQAVLRSLTYGTNNPNPNASGADSSRTITFVAEDAGQISTAVTNVVSVIDAVSAKTVDVGSGHASGGLTLLSAGVLDVLSGGAASGTVVSSTAADFVQSGGSTTGTILASGGDEFVESGGSASSTVADGGSQVVYGSAGGTVLNSGSYLYLESGTAAGTTVSSGVAVVYGSESGTTDYSGGFDFVFSGGTATGTTLSGGDEYIEVGATASGTVVDSGAQVVYGTVVSTVLDSGTSAYLEPGSIASGVTVNDALAVIYGTVSGTLVEGGGFDFVEPGGRVFGTRLSSGAEYVESGAAASATVITSGAEVVYGTTTGTAIDGGSYEYVEAGGTASGTVVNSGGIESIFSLAIGTIVNSGGEDFVNDGAASGTIVSGGDELVEFATSAVGTLVSGAGGEQFVYGSALNTTAVSGGEQVVEIGGVASAAMVDSGGYEYVASGGTAAGVTISGGILELTGGSIDTGAITFVASGGGLLKLDASQAFSGTVGGFGKPDQIDLKDIAFGSGTTLAFQEAGNNQSGTLTVGSGSEVANLTLLGQYVAGQFSIANDGAGGTLVTDPPLGAPSAPAIDYAAALPHN